MQRKQKEDIGLSPYELKFRGSKKQPETRISLFSFNSAEIEEKQVTNLEDLKPYVHKWDYLTWINVDGLDNKDVMATIAEDFAIPSNIMSNIMDPNVRPQVIDYDNGMFVSVKMLTFIEKKNLVEVDNISLILMEDTIITFQEKKGDVFDPVRERIRKSRHKIRNSGTDYLTFALLDVIIDNYIFILDIYGEKIEGLQDNLTFRAATKETLQIINLFQRELNNLSRDIKPAKEMIVSLAKMETDLVKEENEIHFKELTNNINQAVELLDYYRQLLYDDLSIYHSAMSTRLNDIMALLTIYSLIFIPITFIAGVYGMNFDNMPELHTRYGYFITLGAMALIASLIFAWFKRKKWL